METLTIATRFQGPAGSGNGGYVCGRLASYVDANGGPVTVSLRRPPPLDTPLQVSVGSAATLLAGTDVVAEARPGRFDGAVMPTAGMEQARAAEPSYRGKVSHPFPTCFVCGTGRRIGDGMCLSPGLVAPGRTACTWTPDGSLAADHNAAVPTEFVWSALDCPGGWTSDLEARPLVLGTMTAMCHHRVDFGQTYVVVGELVAEQGRKTRTATALYDPTGTLVARAEQVWIAVDPAVFQQLAEPV